MRKSIVAIAVAATLGGLAPAVHAQVYGDTARVLSATPVHDRVAYPRRECRTEAAPGYEERVPVTRDVERCDTIADAQERIVAYEVRYEYNGREFRTRMPYDPGPQMAVNVEVRPPHARDSRAGPRTPNFRGPY